MIPSVNPSAPAIAIESKFTEPYQSREKGCLRQSYFGKQDTWHELGMCRSIAESLTTRPFEHLDAGQLLKHILGLTRAFGVKRFVLLYLWYDVDGSDAARKHEDEVMAFSDAVRGEVLFRSDTYQNVFERLSAEIAGSAYEAYLRSRYFVQGAGTTCS